MQEQEGTFNEQIALEKGTTILECQGILLEDELDFDDGEGILEDGGFILLNGESKQHTILQWKKEQYLLRL